ncbi:hypothetical protein D3C72_1839040 [compost metagenome]
MLAYGQGVAVEGVHAACRQADDRVTTKALATFDGFKQVGIGAVGELQIDRKRRVQVGQHFADNGNMGVAFSGLLLKLSVRDQDDFPSGTQRYGDGRRQQATIATNGVRKKGYAGSSGWTPNDCIAALAAGKPFGDGRFAPP